jgi:outer membrane protein assembly factor BamD (BamD/ComL family)
MTIIKWKTLPVVDGDDDAAETAQLSFTRFVKLHPTSPFAPFSPQECYRGNIIKIDELD